MINFKFKKIQPPLTTDQINTMTNLILEGGEVIAKNIQSRLSKVYSAILVYDNKNNLIAIKSIKKANPKYRDKIFAKAKADDAQNYNYESGYSYVRPEFRRQGIFNQMTELILKNFKHSLYATARQDNLAVIEGLRKFGFEVVGRPFKSNRGKYNLILLIRK
jgi:hypothetical protein